MEKPPRRPLFSARQPIARKEPSLDNEDNQLSKKTKIIIMTVAALCIAAIHVIYIRPRYGDSIPMILFQFFPLYFLGRILFSKRKKENEAKKEPPKESKAARKKQRRASQIGKTRP